MTTIRTRFSPSPTGMLHLGNARTALFSALYAVKNQGVFVLRIEDTDVARSHPEYTEKLQIDLRWLGITWQEGPGVEGAYGPYWQSKRYDIYEKYYAELQKQNLVYPCFCSDRELEMNRKIQLSRGQAPRYPGTCLKLTADEIAQKMAAGNKPALRFHVPLKQTIQFTDLVKGHQRFNSDDIGDFIVRRADGGSSFMFCNAIDDSLMDITNVIRGEDHLTNTPRQLMILRALKLREPQYGHLAMIRNEDAGKLSKREGSFGLHDLRTQGYLAKAVLNYLSRLGHTYDNQALLSYAELAHEFEVSRLSRSPGRFDHNQLLFWQKQSVLSLNTSEIWQWLGKEIESLVPTEHQSAYVELVKHNTLFPSEARMWCDILFGAIDYSEDHLTVLKNTGKSFFETWKAAMKHYPGDLKQIMAELKEKSSLTGKNLFQPMRIALTNQTHGPELAQIEALLGQEKILARIEDVIERV